MCAAASLVKDAKPRFQAAIMVAFNNCPIKTKAFIAELRVLGIDMSDDTVLYNMMTNNSETLQLIELSRVRVLHEIGKSIMRIVEHDREGELNEMKDRIMVLVNFNKNLANDFVTELNELGCSINDRTSIGGLMDNPIELHLLINYSVLGLLRKIVRLKKVLLIKTN
jgi:hypothetical protein